MSTVALKAKKDSIHFLIAIVMGLLLLFTLQPQEGLLSAIGVRAVAIIIPIIYLWITVNTHWVCLLLFALLVIGGVMPPMAIWPGALGHFTIMLILVYTAICMCLSQNGVVEKVAVWFLTRPFVKGRPYAFMFMLFLSMMILGLFMPNMPVMILYISFTLKICDKIGVKKGDSLYTALFLGIFWASCVHSAAAPLAFGVIMIGMMAPLGYSVAMVQWLMAGIFFTFISIFFIMLGVRFHKPDVSPLLKLDIDELAKESPPLDSGGKIAGIIMIGLLSFIMIPELFLMFGIFTDVSRWLVGLSPQVWGMLAITVLCLVKNKDKGEPVMNFLSNLKDVPMSLLLFVAAVNIMAGPVTNPYTGILPWLNSVVSPFVGGMSPTAIMILLLFLAMIQTSFMSNMVTMTMYFNLGLALLADTYISIGAFGILAAFAANFSFLTPAASASAPLWYEPGHITMANSFKTNCLFMVFSAIMLLILVVVVPLIVPA